jgi:histidinol phosphatase-like PHP family hydrolase
MYAPLTSPMLKDYTNKNKKKDAWQEISFHIGIDVDIVEKKLRISSGSISA